MILNAVAALLFLTGFAVWTESYLGQFHARNAPMGKLHDLAALRETNRANK